MTFTHLSDSNVIIIIFLSHIRSLKNLKEKKVVFDTSFEPGISVLEGKHFIFEPLM